MKMIPMAYTTIQINAETRERLAKLKTNRETYDDVIMALVSLVPEGDSEGKYTPEFKASLLRSMLDVKRGKTYSLEEVEKQLGV